jgi:putative acetyltransferase
MSYRIEQPTPTDATRLVEVWEAAVRASHDFLEEADIQLLKPLLIEQYFPQVALYCIRRDDGQVAGFMGYAEASVEMLFVHPDQHGQGLGRALLSYATQQLNARWVDVNEQNPKALAFYLSQGFKVVRRSPLDGGGRPFPILHLQLEQPAP